MAKSKRASRARNAASKTRTLEVVTVRAQDILDRLTQTLDTEHQRVFLRRQWRNEPTPAERVYIARGLDRTGPEFSPEFALEGRRVSVEFAAGYKYGFESAHRAKHPAAPLKEPRMGESLLETAWSIIANAGGGNWDTESREWRGAAARWRDSYHEAIKDRPAAVARVRAHAEAVGINANGEKVVLTGAGKDGPIEHAVYLPKPERLTWWDRVLFWTGY